MKHFISFTCYREDKEFELQAVSPNLALLGEFLTWVKNEYKHREMFVMFCGCKFKRYENGENILEIGYYDSYVENIDWPKLTSKFKELEEKYK
jgi:hypothetical protein